MDDVNEILNQLSFVVSNHFNWDKKSILDYLNNVEDLDYEIVVEKDNLLLLNVKDYETIKRVGKTTNWCISKNKSYWRNYMAHPLVSMLPSFPSFRNTSSRSRSMRHC